MKILTKVDYKQIAVSFSRGYMTLFATFSEKITANNRHYAQKIWRQCEIII